jgi:hypothetical protein
MCIFVCVCVMPLSLYRRSTAPPPPHTPPHPNPPLSHSLSLSHIQGTDACNAIGNVNHSMWFASTFHTQTWVTQMENAKSLAPIAIKDLLVSSTVDLMKRPGGRPKLQRARMRGKGEGTPRKPRTCHVCGKTGHTQKTCSRRKGSVV